MHTFVDPLQTEDKSDLDSSIPPPLSYDIIIISGYSSDCVLCGKKQFLSGTGFCLFR